MKNDPIDLRLRAQTLRGLCIKQDLPIRQVLFRIPLYHSWLRMIFPELVLGSESMNSTIRGYL